MIFFQTIVDCDASESEAPQLGHKISSWLIEQQIITADKADNILSDTLGYPPGPAYHLATSGHDQHLLSLLTNGLAVITNRTLFHSGQGGSDAVCATCSYRFEIGGEEWGAAVVQWFEDSGPGLLACPECGASQAINHWQHDPPLGVWLPRF